MLLSRIYPVTCHTNHVGIGSTFVAIKGFKEDGTMYIQKALERGATTIVIQQDTFAPAIQELCAIHNAKLLTVDNPRKTLAELSSTALQHPSSKLKVIGVTGTKGKTTTTYIIEHILRHA